MWDRPSGGLAGWPWRRCCGRAAASSSRCACRARPSKRSSPSTCRPAAPQVGHFRLAALAALLPAGTQHRALARCERSLDDGAGCMVALAREAAAGQPMNAAAAQHGLVRLLAHGVRARQGLVQRACPAREGGIFGMCRAHLRESLQHHFSALTQASAAAQARPGPRRGRGASVWQGDGTLFPALAMRRSSSEPLPSADAVLAAQADPSSTGRPHRTRRTPSRLVPAHDTLHSRLRNGSVQGNQQLHAACPSDACALGREAMQQSPQPPRAMQSPQRRTAVRRAC